MFSQKFIFIFIFEYPLRIISELIKILVDIYEISNYTDVHDVDENLRTIVNPGGDWILGGMVGIMFREMRYDFTAVHATAASVRRHWKTIKYYTDQHNVDEDLAAISVLGGSRSAGILAGVTYRQMTDIPTSVSNIVASLKNIGHSR